MNDEQVVPAQPPQMSPEERQAAMRELMWNLYVDAGRMQVAVKRGLVKDTKPTAKLIELAAKATPPVVLDPEKQMDPVVLRQFVSLPGDTVRYATGKDGSTLVALDKRGYFAMPKTGKRRKPHKGRNDQGIKTEALKVFPNVFAAHGGKLLLDAKAKAEAEGKTFVQDEFFGVPESDMPKLYGLAYDLGKANWAKKEHGKRRVRRRMQQFNRKVNAGSIPGNTNLNRFVHAEPFRYRGPVA